MLGYCVGIPTPVCWFGVRRAQRDFILVSRVSLKKKALGSLTCTFHDSGALDGSLRFDWDQNEKNGARTTERSDL